LANDLEWRGGVKAFSTGFFRAFIRIGNMTNWRIRQVCQLASIQHPITPSHFQESPLKIGRESDAKMKKQLKKMFV
jgi:hypothetical protein